jgi:hypothetical protein
MGATRRNLQARLKILHKIVGTSNLTKKKYVWYLKSAKEPKIRMRATRNLRARPKTLKKISEHQIN